MKSRFGFECWNVAAGFPEQNYPDFGFHQRLRAVGENFINTREENWSPIPSQLLLVRVGFSCQRWIWERESLANVRRHLAKEGVPFRMPEKRWTFVFVQIKFPWSLDVRNGKFDQHRKAFSDRGKLNRIPCRIWCDSLAKCLCLPLLLLISHWQWMCIYLIIVLQSRYVFSLLFCDIDFAMHQSYNLKRIPANCGVIFLLFTI